ncbi:maleylpyruvate isomerase N-terminal domain-containing protein [Streptomyces sp. DSM 44917]|uniref:Maleylpyruvate isomerase N-terminal domain-containing protein n=1 Tax=Streptomyces boetiae TaxID=3075541 RepID=A0ABU2LAM1_9ACTN|nr:maleylpyruvate isomerase N-terminal domain-containing protein [Streptomyces sp. DSM 44917]MDT0308392.1 maleylpyruvate isomerase N-terminal domain-containing protein [Streptomyces sp. DSM 44917]
MDLFSRSWADLLAAVDRLEDEDFERPSGCRGWLVRDLVCHLVIDAQDVLITLVTPDEGEAAVDAVRYWKLVEPPTGEDPLDALIPRLAAAYGEPGLLKFHLEDLGSAAGRAARLADPRLRVRTQDMVLTAGDYLAAYVFEWTVHHLDLVAHLPSAQGPSGEALTAARATLEEVAGVRFPAALPDADALRVGTGRRAPTEAERAALGETAARLPFTIG